MIFSANIRTTPCVNVKKKKKLLTATYKIDYIKVTSSYKYILNLKNRKLHTLEITPQYSTFSSYYDLKIETSAIRKKAKPYLKLETYLTNFIQTTTYIVEYQPSY